MMDESRVHTPEASQRIPEERAAKILERAAALDAKHNSEVEIDQLREAAADAGISRAAFEEALAEQGEGGEGPAGGRGRPSPLGLRAPAPPDFAMSDVSYYSSLLRDVLGDEGHVSVSDVIEWKDPDGVTASVSPSRNGVTATVTAEGRLRRTLLGMMWAVLPLLLVTFIAAFEEDEFIIMFFGGLIGLVLAMAGASLSHRRERKALRKKVERIRRQLQRLLGPGTEER
jgi:hypothetical protein